MLTIPSFLAQCAVFCFQILRHPKRVSHYSAVRRRCVKARDPSGAFSRATRLFPMRRDARTPPPPPRARPSWPNWRRRRRNRRLLPRSVRPSVPRSVRPSVRPAVRPSVRYHLCFCYSFIIRSSDWKFGAVFDKNSLLIFRFL